MSYRRERHSDGPPPIIYAGLGVLAGVAGYAYYQQRGRNRVEYRPPDSAPGRLARGGRDDPYTVVGRTVTISGCTNVPGEDEDFEGANGTCARPATRTLGFEDLVTPQSRIHVYM